MFLVTFLTLLGNLLNTRTFFGLPLGGVFGKLQDMYKIMFTPGLKNMHMYGPMHIST